MPKAYVRTTRDDAVSTPLQTRMIEPAGTERVIDLDAGHAPQITRPGALADAVNRLVREE